MTLRPVILERLIYNIENDPESDETVKLACACVDEIIAKESIYVLYRHLPNVIAYLKARNIEKEADFNNLLKLKLAKYNIGSYEELQDDVLFNYYESKINSTIDYDLLSMLIKEKNAASWCISLKYHGFWMDPTSIFYSLNSKLMEKHRANKLRYSKEIIIDKWNDKNLYKELNHLIYMSDNVINNIHFLEKEKIDDERNISEDNELLAEPSEEEIVAFRELQCLQLYSLFLNCNFSKLVEIFLKRWEDIAAGLKCLDSSVIDARSLLRIIVYCIILVLDNVETDRVLNGNKLIIDAFENDRELLEFNGALNDLNFKTFNAINRAIMKNIPYCVKLKDAWKTANQLLIQKRLVSFISTVDRISIAELSGIFLVEEVNLVKIITDLIIIYNLPLKLENDVLSYNEKTYNPIGDIHDAVDNECIRVRSMVLNHLLE